MKRRFLFMVMAMFLLTGLSKTMAQASNVDLKGIWQMCFYVSGDPTIPGELKPSNSFKILTDDGKIIAARDRLGRIPVLIGKGEDGYCVSFEAFAYSLRSRLSQRLYRTRTHLLKSQSLLPKLYQSSLCPTQPLSQTPDLL